MIAWSGVRGEPVYKRNVTQCSTIMGIIEIHKTCYRSKLRKKKNSLPRKARKDLMRK